MKEDIKRVALRAAYLAMCATKSQEELKYYMMSKINERDIRTLFIDKLRALGNFPPREKYDALCAEFLLLVYKEPESKVIEKGTIIPGAIAMPPILESDKHKVLSPLEIADDVIVTPMLPKRLPITPITIDDSIAPRSAPLARKIVSSMRPGVMLPGAAPNIATPGRIADAALPREEKQFGIRTKPEGMRRVRIEPEKDPFLPPAPGSDHSPLSHRNHDPDSGRYSVVPPRDSDIPLAVLKDPKDSLRAFLAFDKKR